MRVLFPAELSNLFWALGRLASLALFSKPCVSQTSLSLQDIWTFKIPSSPLWRWSDIRWVPGNSENIPANLGFSLQLGLPPRVGRSQVRTVLWSVEQSCITKNGLLQISPGEILVGQPCFQPRCTRTPHVSSTPWSPSVLLFVRKPRILTTPRART